MAVYEITFMFLEPSVEKHIICILIFKRVVQKLLVWEVWWYDESSLSNSFCQSKQSHSKHSNDEFFNSPQFNYIAVEAIKQPFPLILD